MSGFFGQIMEGVLGGNQKGAPMAAILEQVMSVRDGDKQGVTAIVSKFQSAGLGGLAQSWIGSGQNAPISGDHIGQVFSPEQLDGWAQQAGTTPEALSGILAQALPHLVDHATPNGEVPDQPTNIVGLIGRLLGSSGPMRPAEPSGEER